MAETSPIPIIAPMRKSAVLLFAGAALAVWALWAQSGGHDGFTASEWAPIQTLSPLPALPVDTTNKYRDSDAAALLGQKLFFEPRLSGPIQTGTPAEGQLGAIGETGKIACRNCHMPESKWMFDIRSNNGGAIPPAKTFCCLWVVRTPRRAVQPVRF